MLIVVPAYNPDNHLLEVLKNLKKELNNNIIVVNDGSAESKNEIFKKAEEYALILKHDINKGKGRAMKTALEYIKDNLPDENGVVFVDADGQHSTRDVKKMIEIFEENKDSLILGCRVFDREVPIRSRFGNKLTRFIFKLITSRYVSDTQTGLRAVSTKYIPILLDIEGERYEFEMNMLIDLVRKIKVVEVPIDTIYIDKKNSTSHFRVFRDSFLVYKRFFKFALSSSSCSILDYILFILLIGIIGRTPLMVFLSNILARLVSGAANYIINKKIVFKSKRKSKSLLQYIFLATFILLLNSAILHMLTFIFGVIPEFSKLIVEFLLFFVSFTVQQRVVFSE